MSLLIHYYKFPEITFLPFFCSILQIGQCKTMLKKFFTFLKFSLALFFRISSTSKSCRSSYLVLACVLTGKRAINASRKLRAENTVVEENNGARRKETVNTAAPRKITLMYLYNGRKSSFIMIQDSLEYSATTWF